MTELQTLSKEKVAEQKPVRLRWSELLEKKLFVKEQLGILIAFLLLAAAAVAPQSLVSAEEVEDFICDVELQVEEASKITHVTCHGIDGSVVTIDLEFFVSDVPEVPYSEDQLSHPPSSTMEYTSPVNNINFNCHSLTLQLLEERVGIEFGGDRNSWLQTGFDQFVAQFSEKIVETDTFEARFNTNIIDPELLHIGDIVLFYHGSGRLLHSATVREFTTGEDGERLALIENKLGQAQETTGTIGDIARYYELGGEYEEEWLIGGGRIVVYTPNVEQMQEAFSSSG